MRTTTTQDELPDDDGDLPPETVETKHEATTNPDNEGEDDAPDSHDSHTDSDLYSKSEPDLLDGYNSNDIDTQQQEKITVKQLI